MTNREVSEGLTDEFEISIYQDTDYDPREEEENLGTMLCYHPRFHLGDSFNGGKKPTVDEFKARMAKDKDLIVLPLYLYDHGIQSISTESFVGRAQHAEWDSGQVGWIYTTKQKVREWFSTKVITEKIKEQVLHMLRVEVERYDAYIQGGLWLGTIIQGKNKVDYVGPCASEEGARCEAESLKAMIKKGNYVPLTPVE